MTLEEEEDSLGSPPWSFFSLISPFLSNIHGFRNHSLHQASLFFIILFLNLQSSSTSGFRFCYICQTLPAPFRTCKVGFFKRDVHNSTCTRNGRTPLHVTYINHNIKNHIKNYYERQKLSKKINNSISLPKNEITFGFMCSQGWYS